MRLRVLIAILFLAAPVTAQTQWQNGTTTGDIFYSGGNVGIGTATPSQKLEVFGSIRASTTVFAGSVLVGGSLFTQDANGHLTLRSQSGKSMILDRGNANFQIRNLDALPVRSDFFIDANGNVGVGTTTPSILGAQQLHLDVTGYTGLGGLRINGTDTLNTIYSTQSRMVISTGGGTNQHLILSPNGNVGIGMSSPAQKLEVAGNIALPADRLLLSSADYSNNIMLYENGSGRMAIRTGNTDRLSILYGGNVGIGTTQPAARLEVMQPSAGTEVRLRSFGTGSGSTFTAGERIGRLSMYQADNAGAVDNPRAYIDAVATDTAAARTGAYLAFSVANTNVATPAEAMRIAKDGNVGIGTPTPATKLDVGGSANVAGDLTVTGNITTVTGTITGFKVINAVFQDLAEYVTASSDLDAGTVVVVRPGHVNEVTPSTHAYDTAVAGVVSAQPGITLGTAAPGKETVATTGRVRVRVDATEGPIEVGDLLVTSDIPGTAMKSQPVDFNGIKFHRPGTIVGKALEPLASGRGFILVLLSMQ